MSLCFVDTNVLLYAVDPVATHKQQQAGALIEKLGRAQNGVLSTQVLLEYGYNLTRKFKVSRASAALMTAAFARWTVVDSDVDLVLRAMARSAENDLSVWDAMIVEAALRAQAKTLYTEDLTHGQSFGKLTVVNPFAI